MYLLIRLRPVAYFYPATLSSVASVGQGHQVAEAAPVSPLSVFRMDV
jgi:hypothetical protein